MGGLGRGALVLVAAQAAGCRLGFEVSTDARVDARPGTIAVSDLAPLWATPSSVAWQWDWTGADADLARFELVVGPSQLAVETRGAGSRVVGPGERPELGFATLPGTVDRVVRTVADELAPDADVWAILVAIDTTGGERATSAVKARTTPAPTGELVLYADVHPTGSYALPGSFAESTIMPYAGTMTNRYAPATCPDPSCYENLRRQDLGLSLDALPAAAFDRAYLEMYVANAASEPSYWSDIGVYLNSCAGSGALFRYHPMTVRADDAYHALQVPLGALAAMDGSGTMTADDLATGLCGWWLGGRWAEGGAVSVDEIRVRW